MSTTIAGDFEDASFARIGRRLIPLLFLCYVVAFLDRVNVGFAKLQMQGDLGFSDVVYGFGAGIFFVGYFLFEVPSNLILARIGARVWIARIMISWGIVSSAFLFIGDMQWGSIAAAFGCSDAEFSFYLLRFLLGAAEAGFFPGVILYLSFWFPAARRAHMTASFMTAAAIANVVGSPLSGAIMQFMDNIFALRGWQWLFLLEGLPSVVVGFLVLFWLDDGPRQAAWLSDAERELVMRRLEQDQRGKEQSPHHRHRLGQVFADWRILLLALVYFCGGTSLYAVNFWMPTLIQELGIERGDYLQIGLISMIPWGCAAVCMVWWGAHSDRTGERRWHIAGAMLLACAGLLLLASIGSAYPVLSILGLTLTTCGTLSFVATFWSLPTAFLSGTAAAAGIAWINSLGNLGGHFGPDMIGRIRDASGGSSSAAFQALAAIVAFGAVVVIVLTRDNDKHSKAT